jgi:hypothetical protein
MPDTTTFDMGYRPTTYWPEVTDRLRAVAMRIKGEARRREALARIEAGHLVTIEAWMTEEGLGEDKKRAVQRLHPGLRGGEDLPDLRHGEVEIARIFYLNTVHQEVTVVLARVSGDRIWYRVVDEYSGRHEVTPQSSRRPLTLEQVVYLIDTAGAAGDREGGLVERFWEFWGDDKDDAEDLRGSIEVTSEFYPELRRWYEEAFETWLREHVGHPAEPLVQSVER